MLHKDGAKVQRNWEISKKERKNLHVSGKSAKESGLGYAQVGILTF